MLSENNIFNRFAIGVQRTQINPLPNKPWFLHVCSTCLLKSLWEKKKLLVTSVFCPFEELSAIFNNSEIVVCKLFQFGRV